ncbi:bifunctional diguanylate cyclase/phosphodiesterase [Halarcobacter bivalviorum]|uniref:bifunctional diguanylate cyclase/phosphodiesterase n=1 Tax=Halarcobacter bivalviorum TaxID=663364 RepID=UPI00100A28F3|nr:EAL domain-containing protein [Halarcobacter bivalviorum]RXK02783.1 GGDEF domain-containing protein [Halarcobacter bivalviorum]
MSLSKQLYLIITFIFFVIFTGNFIISIKNTKEYLEIESQTKAQDTATSLGMSLRPLIKDKNDPEIETIIKAISNRGFYKEIRLEDSDFVISDDYLLSTINSNYPSDWRIKRVSILNKFGTLEKVQLDSDLDKQLLKLENEELDLSLDNKVIQNKYRFIPKKEYLNGGKIDFNLTIRQEDKIVERKITLDIKKVIVQEKREVKFDYVPSWFVNLISFNLEEKSSEISDGWKKSAIIYVSPNPGEAYAKLYEQAKSSIMYAIIAFLGSMLLLFIFVQYLLKPLKKIEKLAKSIAQGKFETISELPLTTEIKHVSIAMNDMSRKIESIINKLNKNLEVLSKKLSQDELTKLALRPTFETDMKEMFIQKSSGYILKIKIHSLGSYAKTHTNSEINSFIIDFANILKNISIIENQNIKATAYRFFGSEFMLLIKKCNEDCAKEVCKRLKNDFEALRKKYGLDEVAHIGGTPFNKYGTTPEMLEAATEAYEKAKLIGPNEFFLRNNDDLTRDMEEWRNLVFDIIDNKKFNVDYINETYSFENSNKLLMQEAFTSARDKDDKNIPIGTFVSIAEKYEKVVDFDKAVIQKVIEHITVNSLKNDIMINLSLQTISNSNFLLWLKEIVGRNKAISSQLIFSVTAYAVAKDIEIFKKFCDEIHEIGAKIIVKRFESKFISLESLKDFNLDYIRLARDYTSNISLDSAKQSFVESIQELSTLLNIQVYCENVQSDEDFNCVKKLKLTGASR